MFRRHLALREPVIDHGLSDKFAARAMTPASGLAPGKFIKGKSGKGSRRSAASQLRDRQN
jgi:hypothetical protein